MNFERSRTVKSGLIRRSFFCRDLSGGYVVVTCFVRRAVNMPSLLIEGTMIIGLSSLPEFFQMFFSFAQVLVSFLMLGVDR